MEPHTKFQLSIFIGSPVVVDQSLRGFSGRRSRRLEGEEGPRGPGIGSPKGEMPVCAFIREPINRLSRNLACSTSIPAASQSLNFISLAWVLCAWRPREKYRARAAYWKNDPILTKIDTQLGPTTTHPHTKFQPSILLGSPPSTNQKFPPALIGAFRERKPGREREKKFWTEKVFCLWTDLDKNWQAYFTCIFHIFHLHISHISSAYFTYIAYFTCIFHIFRIFHLHISHISHISPAYFAYFAYFTYLLHIIAYYCILLHIIAYFTCIFHTTIFHQFSTFSPYRFSRERGSKIPPRPRRTFSERNTITMGGVWSPKSPLLVGISALNLVTKLNSHSCMQRGTRKGAKILTSIFLTPQTTIPPSQVWSPKSPLLVGISASNLVTKLDSHSCMQRGTRKGAKILTSIFSLPF